MLTKEFIINEHHNNKKPLTQIAKENNLTERQIYYYVKKLSIETRVYRRKNSIAGNIYHRLTILTDDGVTKGKLVRWRCLCECGKIVWAYRKDLESGRVKSCGCLKLENKGHKHYAWKGCGVVAATFLLRCKRHAIRRKIEFNLTPQFLDNLFIQQKGKCALSGLPIGFEKNNITASLDRIDSSKGYIKENVQWTHKTFNVMKGPISEEQFIKNCKIVLDNHEKKKNINGGRIKLA